MHPAKESAQRDGSRSKERAGHRREWRFMGHLLDRHPRRALRSLRTPMGLITAKLTSPQSKHIRFTLAQDKRLDDACTYLGCSLQSFISEATLERLAKVEAEMRANEDYKTRSKKESSRRREVRGLGLRADRPETAPVEPPPAAPQVVVNIPAAAAQPANDVSMLATFVAKGSLLGRESRLEHAREVLTASLDGAALDAAKKALDEAVIALAPKSSVLDWFKR